MITSLRQGDQNSGRPEFREVTVGGGGFGWKIAEQGAEGRVMHTGHELCLLQFVVKCKPQVLTVKVHSQCTGDPR